MKTVPHFQQIVCELAAKHGIDLDKSDAYLRLSLPEHGQLVIESIGANRISVANYVQVNYAWSADPEIVVYVDDQPGQSAGAVTWYPIESTDFFRGWHLYAEPDALGRLAVYDPQGQRGLADWVEETVASSLRSHGWLAYGVRATTPPPIWTLDQLHARDIRVDELTAVESQAAYADEDASSETGDENEDAYLSFLLSTVGAGDWPEPTTDVPDMDTLGEWTWDYGLCEATDGCPVEPDGTCQHGHPSWLLRLGLI